MTVPAVTPGTVERLPRDTSTEHGGIKAPPVCLAVSDPFVLACCGLSDSVLLREAALCRAQLERGQLISTCVLVPATALIYPHRHPPQAGPSVTL